jgi:hypothetical protein
MKEGHQMPVPRKPYRKGYRRGDGPQAVYTLGGNGYHLSYEGIGGDWWVHFSLCSVPRLRILTWLCLQDEARPTRAVERALGLRKGRAIERLIGMQSAGLVAARIAPRHEAQKLGLCADMNYLWNATEEGRRYLWRYGWVTGRLVPNIWTHDTFHGRTDVCPCDVLAADAAPSLLRPAALGDAYLLWTTGPTTVGRLEQLSGQGGTLHRLQMWQSLGWTEQKGEVCITHPRAPGRRRTATLWGFNRTGLKALERHCHALRWAAQNSGYQVPEDDRFLLGEDQVQWYTEEFTTDR